MTLRQAFAILLSCYIYGHVITVIGALGVFVVFSAVFFKLYYGHLLRKKKKEAKEMTEPLLQAEEKV